MDFLVRENYGCTPGGGFWSVPGKTIFVRLIIAAELDGQWQQGQEQYQDCGSVLTIDTLD